MVVVVTSIGTGAAVLDEAASATAFAAGTPAVVVTVVTPPVGETTTAIGFGVASVGLGMIAIAPVSLSV
jgi:hypothetical protein